MSKDTGTTKKRKLPEWTHTASAAPQADVELRPLHDDYGDDYMSFPTSSVVAPVLPKQELSWSYKRKQCEELPPFQEAEQDQSRERALSRAIQPTKAMRIMEKMGYKSETALGNGTGLLIPLVPNKSHGRSGLGATEQPSSSQQGVLHRSHKLNEDAADYRARLAIQADDGALHADLRAALDVCEALEHDASLGSTNPYLRFLARSRKMSTQLAHARCSERVNMDHAGTEMPAAYQLSQGNDLNPDIGCAEEEFGARSRVEQVAEVVNYLRRAHFYCLWCGIRYDDIIDLDENCPGTARTDHD